MQIDPIKLSKYKELLQGKLPLAAFSRLKDMVSSAAVESGSVVTYKIAGGVDEEGRCFLKGEASTSLQLSCNRCMQPFLEQVEVNFCLYPVSNNDESLKDLEVVIMQEDTVSLEDLIEDELLLNLPQVTMHKENDPVCVTIRNEFLSIEDKGEKNANPFSKLATLEIN